jgi:phosphatidylinositol glycan class M
LDSPYKRETYRYTPLLALLLAPNEWIHPSFGKYLFALCDLVNGILINNLLRHIILPSIATNPSVPHAKTSAFFTAFHLLNPLVFAISTRGSSESVLSLFVLLALYYALKGRWDTAAVFLGVATHWKIYPFIYGVGCLGVVSGGFEGEVSWGAYVRGLVRWRTVRFTVVSAGTFFALGVGCYLM